tara:strand:- start:1149 stop:3572 length:2424 start_codon:yes stop_codon:yes gene_type:complete
MTVFYVDPVNGNDSNNGQSFANRRKTLLSSNVNPYGFIGRDDEIRIIKSSPTSLGNGTWTANAGTSSRLLDKKVESVSFTKANDSNPVSANKTAHGLITGDIILRTDSTYYGFYAVTKVDNDNFTLDGTESQATHTEAESIYKVSEFCVKLASSPIKNILCSNGLSATNGSSSGTGTSKPWTAVQGSTGLESSHYKTQRYASRYFKPGNDATGKVAYCQLDSALDLSAYQQISLRYIWDYIPSGQKNDSGIFSLRLCSDTQGDTVVNTIPITPPPGDDSDSWFWWTYDNGANLGSNINSVALYADVETEHSNIEIILENIIACKAKSAADSLHLGSLISKGTTNTANYYGIDGIVDNIIILKFNHEDSTTYGINTVNTNSNANHLRQNETTGTVTTYKVDPFTPDAGYYNSAEDYACNQINLNGETDLMCTVSGGWNTTDMSSQDTNAMSWFSQFNSHMYMSLQVNPLTSVSNVGLVMGNNKNPYASSKVYESSQPNTIWSNCYFMYHREFSICMPVKLQDCKVLGCGADTSDVPGVAGPLWVNSEFTNTIYYHECGGNNEPSYFTGCTFNGTSPRSIPIVFYTTNDSEGLRNLRFYNCTFKNTTLHYYFLHLSFSYVNCNFSDNVNLFYDDFYESVPQDRKPSYTFIDYNNTANDHRIYYNNGLIVSDSSITQSGSGYSWKFNVLEQVNDERNRYKNPIQFKVAEVAVVANAQVTASIYFRRSATSSGTGTHDECGLALLARPNLHLGITSDVKSLTTSGGTANTWEQVTLNFTPTVSGVATIHALLLAYSTSQTVHIDTFSVTQA